MKTKYSIHSKYNWPRHLTIKNHRMKWFKGEVYVIGRSNRQALRYMLRWLDERVRMMSKDIASLDVDCEVEGVENHIALLDFGVRPPYARLFAPSEIEMEKEKTGKSIEKVLMGKRDPEEEFVFTVK